MSLSNPACGCQTLCFPFLSCEQHLITYSWLDSYQNDPYIPRKSHQGLFHWYKEMYQLEQGENVTILLEILFLNPCCHIQVHFIDKCFCPVFQTWTELINICIDVLVYFLRNIKVSNVKECCNSIFRYCAGFQSMFLVPKTWIGWMVACHLVDPLDLLKRLDLQSRPEYLYTFTVAWRTSYIL